MSRATIVASVVGVFLAAGAAAQTVQTIGNGSAVAVIDRSANFNPLAVNGTPISDYTEGGLFIGTDGDSWVGESWPVFDPFHGANAPDRAFYFPYGGSQGWTEVRPTDGKKMYGVEFMYGNGWTTGDIYGQYPWGNHDAIVVWEARRAGVVVGSGIIGDAPLLEMGTVVGFFDASGIDRLLVKCTSAASGDPSLQALALDNLHVQTTSCTSTTFVQQPVSVSTCNLSDVSFTADAGGMGMLNYQWRKDGVDIHDDGVHIFGSYVHTLYLYAVGPGDSGTYDCVAIGNCGSATSDAATLSVCIADYDCNGFVNGDDFDAFVLDFYWGNQAADIDHNTFVNGDDFDTFVDHFYWGC